MSEREKIEIINLWAVNDLKAEPEIVRFLDSLSPEAQASAVNAVKQCYITGFKKALQHCAGQINETCVKAEMSKMESLPVQKFYEIANSVLSLGTQKV